MKIICAWCPKTTSVETNVSGVEIVSHGICADCMRTHFPELADEPATTNQDLNGCVEKPGISHDRGASLSSQQIGVASAGDASKALVQIQPHLPTFPDRVAGNPAEASWTDSCDAEAGCSLVALWKGDTLLGAARRLVADCMDVGTNDPDCLPGGIEFDEPRRSLFSPRNRFRPGVLGNLMLRSGALRRVA